jgi:integrase/recombinase XerD
VTIPDLQFHIESYIEVRRSLGFNTRHQASMLRAFARHLTAERHRGPIRARMVVDWAVTGAPRNAGPPGQRLRLIHLRCFLRYLKATFPDTEVPVSGVLASVPRTKPFLYSDVDIAGMLQATQLLWAPGSMRQQALLTLIGLLACTGLRASEGLGLTLDDVSLDTNPPRILIRDAKFHKSRIVPVHPTAAGKLSVYLQERKSLCPATTSDAVFLNNQGEPLRYPAAMRYFAAIVDSLGIRNLPGRRRPGLHSLRHTFAVKRLVTWGRAGLMSALCCLAYPSTWATSAQRRRIGI